MSNGKPDTSLHDILALIHDPTFVAFEIDQEAPTIFNAVGRTYTETWHSALLGWLFDPKSSHGLGLYPLNRLLMLLQIEDTLDVTARSVDINQLLTQGELSQARVRPNERDLTEVSVTGVGRFDILTDQIELLPWKDIQILIEVKVNAPIDKNQCQRYISYIEIKKKENVLIIPVFVAQENYLIGSSKDLFGDDSWIRSSFRDIYDDIIEPCLNHRKISDFGKYTLGEYVKTLKHRQKGGEPLAITQKDREMVNALMDRHGPAIQSLYEILSQSSDDFEPLTSGGNTAKEAIKIKVGNKRFSEPSISKIYYQVLKFLDEKGSLDTLELPIASGAKRYLLAREPFHQQGNSFLKPVEYKGYYMEANKSRIGGLSDLSKLLNICGLSLEVIPVASAV
jgi:hypothetical protein